MPDAPNNAAGGQSAHVGSSDAIVDYRAALHTFLDEVNAALESVRGKAGKALRWLDEDAPGYWHAQEQRGYDTVNSARTALTVCKTQTVAGRRKSCIEEKAALSKAKDRLEVCRVQRAAARAASIDAHAAADDYRARIAALERFLESELPKLAAVLHRTSVALDAYSATRPTRRDPGSAGGKTTANEPGDPAAGTPGVNPSTEMP